MHQRAARAATAAAHAPCSTSWCSESAAACHSVDSRTARAAAKKSRHAAAAVHSASTDRSWLRQQQSTSPAVRTAAIAD
eukprot:3577719-Prymnesium_polylepis.1